MVRSLTFNVAKRDAKLDFRFWAKNTLFHDLINVSLDLTAENGRRLVLFLNQKVDNWVVVGRSYFVVQLIWYLNYDGQLIIGFNSRIGPDLNNLHLDYSQSTVLVEQLRAVVPLFNTY